MKRAAESICAVVLAALLMLALPAASLAAGSETLAQIEARGALRCGVSEGIAGFSAQDASGRWTGMDADFCRAVAAAALGDPDKVAFVPLRTSARFPALRTRRIDLLARNTTWTLLREGTLGVQFAGVLFYDAQAFMVWTKNPIRASSSLNGATVCVLRDTSSEGNLSTYAEANALDIKPLVVGSVDALERAFLEGQCSASTGDASLLAALQARAPGGASSVVILPERISREPLGPVVRDDDSAWLTVVRWVLFTLIAAEELGVTRANHVERMRDPRVARALVPDAAVTTMLGLKPGWTARALNSAGNYGEMFDRNLGSASPLQMKRGLNDSWTRGGLMYAPPMQ
ncbi:MULTISPECIES: amino acid ABC transporter substrate-binding protein [unclassified Caballeronia]|uniref:amino acid ABC transporter substrate-binding protein n=1 Tax=unclassified Caballeronia TaxID=2646786 RepID=UPI002029969A|nr:MULTISPECIES: amino acid ABC transporter substrate-binding protein [unclassified Caballeronia]